MANEILDNIDFQQEKRYEMEREAQEECECECCSICGEHLLGNEYVYKKSDNTYVHTRCLLDYIDSESELYGDVCETRRDIKSTEEIF